MRHHNTLTFNEESWLTQPHPTNPIILNIYKNGINRDNTKFYGINTEYFLETITGDKNIGEPAGILGYKLYHSIGFIKDLHHREINFNLMVDLVTAIQIHSKELKKDLKLFLEADDIDKL